MSYGRVLRSPSAIFSTLSIRLAPARRLSGGEQCKPRFLLRFGPDASSARCRSSLLFDGGIKLANIPPVTESFVRLGYRPQIAVGIGILELACVALYLIPRTSAAGAVLLTGFLGGAVATHLRVGDPLLTHVFFPLYVGALLWAGLLLRSGKLGNLLLRTSAA